MLFDISWGDIFVCLLLPLRGKHNLSVHLSIQWYLFHYSSDLLREPFGFALGYSVFHYAHYWVNMSLQVLIALPIAILYFLFNEFLFLNQFYNLSWAFSSNIVLLKIVLLLFYLNLIDSLTQSSLMIGFDKIGRIHNTTRSAWGKWIFLRVQLSETHLFLFDFWFEHFPIIEFFLNIIFNIM